MLAIAVDAAGGPCVARAQSPAPSAASAARQFAAATALQNQEQFGKAAEEWDRFLKDHPDDVRADRAWHHLGVCRMKNKQYAEAQTAFERLIADRPKSTLAGSAWLNLGLAQYDRAAAGQTEFYPKAAETFATLLQKFPRAGEAPRALFYRAEALYAQGESAAAAKLYADFIHKYPQDPLLADALYAQGVALQEIGSPAAAGASYDAWLKQFADRPLAAEVTFRRGETLLAQQKFESAEKWFASAASKPGFELADLALLRQATCLEQRREYARAAAKYQALLEQFPEGEAAPRAMYGLGWTQLSLQDYAAAAQTLDRLLAKHPAEELAARAHYARALAREQLKQYGPALEDARAFLHSSPTGDAKSDARYLVGLCQARLEQWSDAAATFRELLAADPKYVGVDKTLYELAWTLVSLDEAPAAADAWRRLAKQYPHSPLAAESLYQVAEQELAQEDFAAAAADFHQAMQKAGKAPLGERAAHQLGRAYFRQEAFEKARQTFVYQRQTFPDGRLAGDAAFMEGESLLRLGKYADALAAYAKARDPSGEDAGVLLLLHSAQAAAKLKQWDKSLGLLAQAAERFGDSPYLPDVRFAQGWAKQNLGSLNEAQALYEEVTAATDREIAAQARFLIGQMYFEQKQYDEAVKNFVKAAYGYSYPRWQSRAHFEAGRSFEALGKRGDAVKSYQEILDQFPDSGEAPRARQRLAALENEK